MRRRKVHRLNLTIALSIGLVVYFALRRGLRDCHYHVARFNQLLLESGSRCQPWTISLRDYFVSTLSAGTCVESPLGFRLGAGTECPS